MRILTILFAAGIVPALVGCASADKSTVLAPVGPAPAGPAVASREGYLKVYSARQRHEPMNIGGVLFTEGEHLSDDMLYDRAHTGYTIYNEDGKTIKQVRNAKGINDQTPTRVMLPPGTYTVQAESRNNGLVTVPVVVRAGQLTAVHLQPDWVPASGTFHDNEFVWLVGERVGWSATAPVLTRAENNVVP